MGVLKSNKSVFKKDVSVAEVADSLQSHDQRWRWTISISILILAVSVLISLSSGTVSIPFSEVIGIVIYKLTSIKLGDWEATHQKIIWSIRFPRILAGVLSGAGLSIAGASMQAILRNPLASPYLLGVSSGASLGASLVILLGLTIGAWVIVPLGAFGGAMLALTLVLLMGRNENGLSTERLILAGVAISALFGALTSFVLYISPDKGMREIIFWTLGSFQSASWTKLIVPFVGVCIGTTLFIWKSNALNAMLMGEETAYTLGINPVKLRKQLFVVVSIVAGGIVALYGVVGFVGLMIPHIVRLLIGNDYRKILIACLIAGAIFMLWADWAARILFSPLEIPLGIITSLVGAPFFLWLMGRVR